MPRRRYTIDEKRAARFVKEGRGQGDGADYKPWLTIQDTPSHGRSHRLRGMTTGRTHHFLSDLEKDLFLLLDWQLSTIDLREQFPLDLEATHDIADRLNIRHPQAPGISQPMVMTTDLVVDRRGEKGVETRAYAVKTAEDLEKPRTLRKLEIEWVYWKERGTPWNIVTRAELPKRLIDNISWIHGFFSPEGMEERLLALTPLCLSKIADRPQVSLGDFCDAMDQRHDLPPGSCLTLMRHLLATRRLACDMESLVLNGHLPLSALTAEHWDQQRGLAG